MVDRRRIGSQGTRRSAMSLGFSRMPVGMDERPSRGSF
ncbi:hypothetical protein FH063_000605 [Azospirillum argentinense]|uniref:Uncharacterized protein n=1 Tax=Azospirillum argentinense TaxID=2970906 RepID=A0A5B0L252_9PROT|nr:hypothetical protein FH063_000605 [Azospirillum argentinense]